MDGQGERDRCQPQRSPLRIRIAAITAGLVLQVFALGELAEDLLCSNLVGHEEEYIAEQEDRASGSPAKIRAARDVGNNSHARIPTPDPKSWFRFTHWQEHGTAEQKQTEKEETRARRVPASSRRFARIFSIDF